MKFEIVTLDRTQYYNKYMVTVNGSAGQAQRMLREDRSMWRFWQLPYPFTNTLWGARQLIKRMKRATWKQVKASESAVVYSEQWDPAQEISTRKFIEQY